MTELEKIQLLLTKKFGCDIAMAVYMAVMCYRPTENDSLEYGMRAMHAWRELYEEDGLTQAVHNWDALETDRKAGSNDDCHDDYDSCLE